MVKHIKHRSIHYDNSETLIVEAGFLGWERIVPPAGARFAFDREIWKRRVEIYASPAGRSIRIWIDGEEVK